LPDGKPIAVLCKRVEQATTDADGHLGFTAAVQTAISNRVWTYSYNQYGQVLTETDPRGGTTTRTYYTDTTPDHTTGDLQSVTDAVGLTTQYARYNPHGQVLRVVDANGVATDALYDARQRLTSTTTAGKTTTYAYWPTGLLKQFTLSEGNWIAYRYDDAHRLVSVSDNAGNSIAYTLDAAGNRTKEDATDPAGTLKQTLGRVMDALGIVQQTSGRE
jgi:YD repeat-containing protein